MTIYILRHGETEAGIRGCLQGWQDEPLNENGIRLARITGRSLAGIRFDACFSSPLSRALDTARIVLAESGNRDVPIRVDGRIKEIHMGEWEGLQVKQDGSPDTESPAGAFFADPFSVEACPGGERIRDVLERTQSFLEELIRQNTGENILVSTHGFASRAMLNRFYEDPRDFWHGRVPPHCAVNIIRAENGTAELIGEDRIFY